MSECNHTVSYLDKTAHKVHTYQVDAIDCPHCLRVMLENTAVEIERLRAGLTFAVEEDHAIRYFGADFSKAQNNVRGGNKISVWRDGKWLGDVAFNGKWLCAVDHSDKPDVLESMKAAEAAGEE